MNTKFYATALKRLASPQAGSLLPELIPLPHHLEGEEADKQTQEPEPPQTKPLKRPNVKKQPRVRQRKSARTKRPSPKKHSPQKRTKNSKKRPQKSSKKTPESTVTQAPVLKRVVLSVLGKPYSGQALAVKVKAYDEANQKVSVTSEVRFEAFDAKTKAKKSFSGAPVKLTTGTWKLKACVHEVCSATRELFVRSAPPI